MSPALAERFSTTEPLEKPHLPNFKDIVLLPVRFLYLLLRCRRPSWLLMWPLFPFLSLKNLLFVSIHQKIHDNVSWYGFIFIHFIRHGVGTSFWKLLPLCYGKFSWNFSLLISSPLFLFSFPHFRLLLAECWISLIFKIFKVKFIVIKFKVRFTLCYNSVNFDRGIQSCHYHHNQDIERSHHSKKFPQTFFAFTFLSLPFSGSC